MSNPETKPIPSWDRVALIVSNDCETRKLESHLKDGWKLDPWLPTVRLEDGAIFFLLRLEPGCDLAKADITIKAPEEETKPNEFADTIDFVSVEPDKVPNGVVKKLTDAGWVQVGFAAAKNLVQLKLPRPKSQSQGLTTEGKPIN